MGIRSPLALLFAFVSIHLLLAAGRLCDERTVYPDWPGPASLPGEAPPVHGDASVFDCTLIDLQESTLSSSAVVDLAAAIVANSSDALDALHLNGVRVGDVGASALAQAALQKSQLAHADLGAMEITASGAAAWATALGQHPSLQRLELEWNQLGDDGVSVLAGALHGSGGAVLSQLGLQRNGLGDAAASAIAAALRTNARLQNLSFEGNQIGPTGAQALGTALSTNGALRTLNLALNALGPEVSRDAQDWALRAASVGSVVRCGGWARDDSPRFCARTRFTPFLFGVAQGASGLATGLLENSALESLELSETAIGDAGVVALARALRINSSLRRLNLQGNGIGDAGALALAEALRLNTGLTSLSLDLNSIGPTGAAELLAVARVNTVLREVTLEHNSIYPALGEEQAGGERQLVIAQSTLDELASVLSARGS